MKRVAIPQSGLESLNVAMAGTILLYELTARKEEPCRSRTLCWGSSNGPT